MRLLCSLPLWLLPLACATPARLVTTATDTVTNPAAVAEELAKADVVVLGEHHDSPAVHATHLQLLRELQARRGDVVIAMEMFERDVQPVLLQYLAGLIDEDTFLASARPWDHYARDYRPVVEFAKAHGLVVLAANAPRPLAAKVARGGIADVLSSPFVARATTAPEDEYWDAFQVTMAKHGGGVDDTNLHFYYEAQCLKDDTMAESIVDHLQARRTAGARPMVVLFCGVGHSDYGRGTVARIKSRMPDLDVRVLSTESVADLSTGVYSSPRAVADYVIVTQDTHGPTETMPAPVHQAASAAPLPNPHHPKVPAVDPSATGATAEPSPVVAPQAANSDGQRPALGLMPDYGYQGGDGVLVASVRGDGPADKAGLQADDVIVALAGLKVTDVTSYTEALDAQVVGKTVTVRVRREGAEVDLQVQLGARSR